MAIRIIGLASTTGPGSGKSYTADAIGELAERGYKVLHFASPVKRAAEMITQRVLNQNITFALKTDVVSAGVTVRDIYRAVGDSMRKIDPDIWVNLLLRQIEDLGKHFDLIIVDDVRYKNEYEAIKKLGGRVFNVVDMVPKAKTPDSGDLTTHDFPVGHFLFNDRNSSKVLEKEIQMKVLPLL